MVRDRHSLRIRACYYFGLMKKLIQKSPHPPFTKGGSNKSFPPLAKGGRGGFQHQLGKLKKISAGPCRPFQKLN